MSPDQPLASNGPQAQAALDEAQRVSAAIKRGYRWFARYLAILGVLFLGITMALPYLDDLGSLYIFLGAVGGAVLAVCPYLALQRVVPPGCNRRIIRVFPYWAALYFPLAVIGPIWFERELGYWVPAALATALPWFVAAYREVQR